VQQVVLWSVFEEPVELSADQIARHEAIFDDNNRPVQPRDNRQLLLGG
jgi:carbonic anhydrase